MVLGWLSMIGALAFMVALVALGRISRRLGHVTHAPPFYRGFYISAVFIGLASVARFISLAMLNSETWHDDGALNLAHHSLMALGATIALTVAWRYWSWLLAERD